MSKADFISQIYQAGLAAGLTDAAARVMASQAAIESAYGDKAPGNNMFGIKAGKSWTGDKQLLTTHEVVNGKRVKVKDWFRAYPTVEEGIADRVDFMASRFPEFNTAPDMGTALDALQNGKYGKYYTHDRGEYEGIVNYVNTKFLDGNPVPPANVGGVASELSVSTPSAVGRGVVPQNVPLPRPRPEREFDPLPFPGPLVAPREDTAARSLGASAGNRNGMSVTPVLGWKNGEPDSTTSAGNNVIPASDYQAARNLGSAGADPRLQVLGQPRVAPVVAPTMADTRAEQRMAPTAATIPPAVARPGAGLGAVAGMGGVAGAAGGVVPLTAAPAPAPSGSVAPAVPAAVPRPASPIAPVQVATAAPSVAAAPSGGNILGAIGGGFNFLGSKAQELGSSLGNTAVQAKDAVVSGAANMADKTVDAIIPQAMQSVKVRTAFIDPMLARGFTDKPGYTIKDSPTKYGKTQAERQEAAAKRQALMDGKPYVPSTGVKSQIDTSPMPSMFKGTSTGRTYTVGKTYQSSRGPVIATANGFQPAGAATKPSAKQSRAERFSNLDSFGNII